MTFIFQIFPSAWKNWHGCSSVLAIQSSCYFIGGTCNRKFELAAYVDAGNIWSMRAFEIEPNGNFDFSRFYKEIAVSYGLGLRMDFDFFLLRLDTGFKAYDPQQSGSRRWAIKRPNFKDNFALHFAVGYPF